MPTHLRPTAPTASDAILVGDPGRALLLAQELLEQPKMSNHARGLWGYYGTGASGRELTVQSTGIGGPSAALVLGDLAELGVRRAVRVGTCMAVDPAAPAPGGLVVVAEAIAAGGSAGAFGAVAGEAIPADPGLTEQLGVTLGGEAAVATVGSVDTHPGEAAAPAGALALDMQTAALLARAQSLQVAAATILIVTESAGDAVALEKDALEERERLAGRGAAAVLSG